jgi:predicted transcriptional regulator
MEATSFPVAKQERRAFGELQGRILGVLWAAGRPLTAAEVLTELGDDVVYTTVAKVLDRLQLQDVVRRAKVGRAYTFEPLVQESAFVADRVRGLLDRSRDREAVLQGFVDGLEPGDSAILAAMLDRLNASASPSPGS